MIISTRGRYALRVMIDLAEQKTDSYIPLKEIAARQEISEKYLESILKLLVKGNALAGVRGKKGGYRLTKAPEEYTVISILEQVEEALTPVPCIAEHTNPCHRSADCKTLDMWKGLEILIRDYFHNITLADLVNG